MNELPGGEVAVPIVPAGIVGTNRVQPPGTRVPRPFRPVTVQFGSPIDPTIYAGSRRHRRRLITNDVMASIQSSPRRNHARPVAGSVQQPSQPEGAGALVVFGTPALQNVASGRFGSPTWIGSRSASGALDQHHWATRHQLATAIFEWIECWYNPHRRHSYCDGLRPIDYEAAQAE